jgi:cytochrome c biogenesis protein CcdA/thioredoxin-related protein
MIARKNRMKKRCLSGLRAAGLLLFMTLAVLVANAQTGPVFSGKDPDAPHAEFPLVVSKTKDICVGDVITLTFRGKILTDGWHLYSSRDDGNIAYNPTMLDLFTDESKGVKLKGKMTENHKPNEVDDEIMGGIVRDFHEKQVDFSQRIEITGPNVVLKGVFSVQFCDPAGMCMFPKIPISWVFTAKDCGLSVTPTIEDTTNNTTNPPLNSAEGFQFVAYDSLASLSHNVLKQDLRLAEFFPAVDSGAVCAFYHPAQAQAYAAKVGRPLLMYFTSQADSASRQMEAAVFKNPAVDSILRYRVVVAKFYVDAQNPAPADLQLANGSAATTLGQYFADYQLAHFGAANHPLFALSDAAGRKYAESIGITDAASFAGWLKGSIAEYYTAQGKPEAAWLPGVKATTATNGVTEEAGDCSLWSLLLTFIKAMGGGFLALLTPCVFPMIPMTVSFFVKQGEGSENRKKGLRNAITYALSIVFIYGIVGFFISVFLPPDTLYKLGSDIVPNMIFFVIFLAFALSFFGLFEITLPSRWSSAMNNKAGAGGMLGPFFMAMTLVIVSFSCTGPILGTAIVQASSGSICKWNPFLAFLGFGVAFAIPFGLLAIFPRLLEKLPMAGGWMNTVKVVFGFLELALCLKFLSNVDLVTHWHLLDRSVFLGIWIVIFSLLGAYLLGWITMPHDEKLERVSVMRLMFAVGSFSFAMYLVPGLWGAPLQSLEGLIPPITKNVGVKLLPHQVESGGGNGEKTLNKEICEADRKYSFIAEDRESHGLCMFYDLDQALEFAKAKNKPVFVDFTGHSCANCRRMENGVWPDEKIMGLLTKEFVTVSLYADERHRFDTPKLDADGGKLRDIGSWVNDYQRRNYGLISQPYYVLMDYDESDLIVPGVGYTPDVDTYYAYLKSGLAEFNKRHGIVPAGE